MNTEQFGWVTTVTLEISTDVRLTVEEARAVHVRILDALAVALGTLPTSSGAFVLDAEGNSDSDEDLILYGEAHLSKCDYDDDDPSAPEDPKLDRYTGARFCYKSDASADADADADADNIPLSFVTEDAFYGIGTEKSDSERETEEEW